MFAQMFGTFSTDTITASGTASDAGVHFVDTGAARTVTLSTVAVSRAGNAVIILDDSGTANTNNITVATEGAETINGANTVTITAAYGGRLFISNGTNWRSVVL